MRFKKRLRTMAPAVVCWMLLACSEASTTGLVDPVTRPNPTARPSLNASPSATVVAQSFTVTKQVGAPTPQHVSLTIPGLAAYQQPMVIRVTNGPHREATVSSAWISLDGDRLFTPADFNAHPSVLEIEREIKPAASLDIILNGAPGGVLQVEVLGRVKPGFAVIGASGGIVESADGLAKATIGIGLPEGSVATLLAADPLSAELGSPASPAYQLLVEVPNITTGLRQMRLSSSVAIPKITSATVQVSAANPPTGGHALQAFAQTGGTIPTLVAEASENGDVIAHFPIGEGVPPIIFELFVVPILCPDQNRLIPSPGPEGVTPVVYIHGWQPDRPNCLFSAFFDASAQGANLEAELASDPELEGRYRFYRFTYPTFLDPRSAAAYLSAELRTIASPENKAIIVAHSMGGLVARAAIELQEPGIQGIVGTLITLGTPHAGSPLASASVAANELLQRCVSLVGLTNPFPTTLAGLCPGAALFAGGMLVTDGARALNPNSSLFDALDRSPFVEVDKIAGTIDAETDCGPTLLCLAYRIGAENLLAHGFGISDGVVPVQSALDERVPGVQHTDVGQGYTHSDLANGLNNGQPEAVLYRVHEIIAGALPKKFPMWCNQTLDFNNGLLPQFWTVEQIRGGPGLVNDRLEGRPVDSGVYLHAAAGDMRNIHEIEYEYDAANLSTYWGMNHGLGLNTATTRFTLIDQNATFNFGAQNLRLIEYSDHQERVEFNVPFEYGTFHYRVKVTEQGSEWWVSRGGEGIAHTFLAFTSLKLRDVTSLDWMTYTTTDNPTWSDNLKITCR